MASFKRCTILICFVKARWSALQRTASWRLKYQLNPSRLFSCWSVAHTKHQSKKSNCPRMVRLLFKTEVFLFSSKLIKIMKTRSLYLLMAKNHSNNSDSVLDTTKPTDQVSSTINRASQSFTPPDIIHSQPPSRIHFRWGSSILCP